MNKINAYYNNHKTKSNINTNFINNIFHWSLTCSTTIDWSLAWLKVARVARYRVSTSKNTHKLTMSISIHLNIIIITNKINTTHSLFSIFLLFWSCISNIKFLFNNPKIIHFNRSHIWFSTHSNYPLHDLSTHSKIFFLDLHSSMKF